MKIEASREDIYEGETDSRGRFNFTTNMANKKLEVVVTEVKEADES